MKRILLACLAGALAVAPGGGPLAAQERGRTERESGPSLPRAVAREVVDFYNDPATMRVNGAFDVASDRSIDSAVAVLGGPVTVAGRIRGRLLVINGDLTFRPGARVDGDVTVVGGVVDGRQDARLDGELRIYRQALRYRLEDDRLVAERPDRDEEERPWWRRRDRYERHTYTSLSLGSAKTYNRVEGLPIKFGPSLTHDFPNGRLRVDARGIFRTAGEFKWDSANVGHDALLELQLGRRSGVRVGGRLYDEVEAIETWQLGEVETGLASFFAHRDYRDYYNRHGGRAYLTLLAGRDADVTVSLADERWASRDVRDPWTLFRNKAEWRPNPHVDEGRVHVANATLRIDTRNDEDNPWSGWYLVADYERGTGGFTSFGPLSADLAVPGTPALPGARSIVPGTRTYGRGFFDVRRYNRLSPEARIDLRLVGGGWLHGDPLPLERRFSLTGPGAMPGFDFRRPVGASDPGQCSAGGLVPPGSPGQCERFVMGQVELRGDLRVDYWDDGSDDRRHWNGDLDLDGSWVVFADAGRGWLVGDAAGADMVYPKGNLPPARTFMTDIGIGFDFGDRSWGDRGTIGVYAAKSVSRPSQPINFFVRVRRRF